MKSNLFFIIFGLIIFAVCFLISVSIRDYFHEQFLRTNIRKVKVGMSAKEAIDILGSPDMTWMSDGDGRRWCYNTDSIAATLEPQPEISCQHILLRGNNMIEEVYDFDR